MKIRNFIYVLILAAIAGCKPEISTFSPSKGTADFTKYVAIGNSLTAGYADGDCYKTGQSYSYSNILAQQLKLVGGGDFKMPYMFDELGFGRKMVLGPSTDCLGVTSLGPVSAPGTPSAQNFASIASQGPFNCLGVPGAKSYEILAPHYGDATLGLGNYNPYFARFCSSLSASMIGDALAQHPSFFSLWIGNNDVLLYAVNGGEGSGQTVTSTSLFTQAIYLALDSLISTNAKGAVGNIPDITNIPYFNTVPIYGLVLDDTKAAMLNAGYANYNTGAQAYGVPKMNFHAGPNAFVIKDTTFPYNNLGGLRQIRPGEFIILTIPQDSLKCAYWGSQKPIPGAYVLDASEVQKVMTATTTFNATIKGAVDEINQGGTKIAFVDMNSYFKQFQSGLVFDGIKLNTVFVQGGLFSLDGIHPNPRGQAVVANYFIDAINSAFGAQVPKVNISDYPGIMFP